MSEKQLGPWPWINSRGEVCCEGPSPEMVAYAERIGGTIVSACTTLTITPRVKEMLDKPAQRDRFLQWVEYTLGKRLNHETP